jgi:hypothetical protein
VNQHALYEKDPLENYIEKYKENESKTVNPQKNLPKMGGSVLNLCNSISVNFCILAE